MQKTKRHAIINRIHVRLGLALALVGGFSLSANAGYAQLAPPPGFSSAGGSLMYKTAANDAIGNGINRLASGAAVNIGGRAVTMPAAVRFASNASLFAARSSFGNPWIFATLAVGSAAYSFYKDSGFEVSEGVWVKKTKVGGGEEYRVTGWDYGQAWASTQEAALTSYCGVRGLPNCRIANAGNSIHYDCPDYGTCSTGFPGYETRTSPEVIQVQLPTQQEFEDALKTSPLPADLPKKLPDPLPVELPIVNPEPLPATNPRPLPLFIPTGNPVPNPNYDPNAAPSPENQPWIQPAVRLVPSPTPAEPWRVDLQPVNRPVPGPEPMSEPLAEVDPNAPTNDKPSEEQLDFCAKNPDVLACAKPELDTPEDEIPKDERDVQFIEENLFGAGGCPADVYFAPHGLQQLKVWDWNQSCGYITEYLKPILIICCTFAAFMILIPGRTE